MIAHQYRQGNKRIAHKGIGPLVILRMKEGVGTFVQSFAYLGNEDRHAYDVSCGLVAVDLLCGAECSSSPSLSSLCITAHVFLYKRKVMCFCTRGRSIT
jgi:hypothetical protein